MKNYNEIINEIKNEALLNHVPILQDDSLELITVLLKIAKPSKILEIGTAVGYSAIKFSKCLYGDNSNIKTVEINEKMYEIANKNVSKMDLNNKIEIVHADATKYLEELDENIESFDVVFIDAAKGQYIKFLENAIRLVNSGGIIIADNVLFKGRVLSDYNEHKHRTATNRLREYIKIIKEDKRLVSTVLDVGDGVAISFVDK